MSTCSRERNSSRTRYWVHSLVQDSRRSWKIIQMLGSRALITIIGKERSPQMNISIETITGDLLNTSSTNVQNLTVGTMLRRQDTDKASTLKKLSFPQLSSKHISWQTTDLELNTIKIRNPLEILTVKRILNSLLPTLYWINQLQTKWMSYNKIISKLSFKMVVLLQADRLFLVILTTVGVQTVSWMITWCLSSDKWTQRGFHSRMTAFRSMIKQRDNKWMIQWFVDNVTQYKWLRTKIHHFQESCRIKTLWLHKCSSTKQLI